MNNPKMCLQFKFRSFFGHVSNSSPIHTESTRLATIDEDVPQSQPVRDNESGTPGLYNGNSCDAKNEDNKDNNNNNSIDSSPTIDKENIAETSFEIESISTVEHTLESSDIQDLGEKIVVQVDLHAEDVDNYKKDSNSIDDTSQEEIHQEEKVKSVEE